MNYLISGAILILSAASCGPLGAIPPGTIPWDGAHGLGAEYVVETWGTAKGLPQGSVLALTQTHDRYLWLATFGGLVRFDGLSFTTLDASTKPGIGSNRIIGLCEDSQGALWIGTQESGLIRYYKGETRAYTTRDGLPSDYIRAVNLDEAGNLWAATWKGLATFQAGHFKAYVPSRELSGQDMLSLARGRDSLWIGTNGGIARLQRGRVSEFRPTQAAVTSLYADQSGTLWAGTSTGLWRFSIATPIPGMAIRQLRGEIRSIFEDSGHSLWVGAKDGLWRRRPNATSWIRYGTADGLTEDYIRSVTEDAEGNLWIGTNARGLNCLKKRQVRMVGVGGQLPADNVVPVLEDLNGIMWYGLTCGGLVRFDGRSYRIYGTAQGLPDLCVWSLAEDTDGSLWIGTRGGLAHLAHGAIHNYTSARDGLSDNWVTSIYRDRKGTLWIGTGDGLNVFDAGRFRIYRKRDGLVEDEVRFLTEDSSGALWIGTTGGISRFASGVFTNYTRESGLPHNFVRAIHFDSDGAAWIGTYGGGLGRFKNGHFTTFNSHNGLPENIVSCILEDAAGDLWLSGNRGIHRVSRRELDRVAEHGGQIASARSFGVSEGMRNRETNGGASPAGWQTRGGALWFPTQEGVAVLAPGELRTNQPPPPVVIEQILVDLQPVDPTRALELPPSAAELEIRYTGLNFAAPEAVRFRYRLADLQRDWIEAGTRRSAFYSHLPPGKFEFRLTAANGDGVWNAAETRLAVIVKPAFWVTWWFRSIVALALAMSIAGLYRRRVQAYRQAALEQWKFSRRLIESQETERQRIAAELHDSLGQTLAIIKNRALVSLTGQRDAVRAFEQMEEIVNAADEALTEVRDIAYDLRPYHLDRLGLSKAIEAMIANAARAATIRFTVRIEDIDGVLSRDNEIYLYRIVQEAVNNILKHSGATEAHAKSVRRPDGLSMLVTDNGSGFHLAAQAEQAGLGLRGMTERAKLLGAHLTIHSTPGEGTAISVTVAGSAGK
ncbi:MAG: two-component regulator propeller domain-containing protein [Bryobacteraceae bacterium]|jgi:ligand-binding sensor domain-containing protein/signal transduction histidine kinase